MNLKHIEAIYNPRVVFNPEGFSKVTLLGKDTIKVSVISAKRRNYNYKRLIVHLGENVVKMSDIPSRVSLFFNTDKRQLVLRPEKEGKGIKIGKNRYLTKEISTRCILNDLDLFRSKEVEFKLIDLGGILIQL